MPEHGHDQAHGHGHDVDWAAIAPFMVARQALEVPVLRQLLAWLTLKPGAVVADVGCGVGGMVELLAEAVGPTGMVYAVDGEEAMRAATRSLAASCGVSAWVDVRAADLERDALRDVLGREVDLVHASAVVHHLADEVSGLRRLGTALRPGGRIVVIEGGMPNRHLPADCGIGRPGLEERMLAAQQEWFWSHVRPPGLQATAGAPTGWNEKLISAGYVDVTARSFLLDLPAPLPARARETVRGHFAELRRRFGDRFDREDIATLEVLLDESDPRGVLHRSDVFVLGVRTAYVGRKDS
ncbi:MAG TPA: class I SAM-dependent methyltransferase [Acidimicrobiales bacterium]|nr:class I SAM-dependent methyltransferase [Acidimicrobiales bacterium]